LNDGINFFIHDLNPYGGQDRSTLEILQELSERMPVHVYACSYENPAHVESRIVFHPCPFRLRRPVLLKSLLFQAWSAWVRFTHPRRITFSTGTCALFADVVHVQFLANAWRQERHKLLVRRGHLHSAYHRVLAAYNEAMERVLYRRGQHFAAISSSVASDLRRLFRTERVSVIHHGVDGAAFAPAACPERKLSLRRELGLPEEKRIFLFVGAYDRKGLAVLLRAADQLRRRQPGIAVVAVGNGDREAHRQLVDRSAADGWLYLHPPSKRIELYYQAADYFVLPTLYEPFGLVVLEAMGAGLPVVVSRVAGASDLIREGKDGFLLEDPTDADELEAKMEAILASDHAILGLAARERALSRSWSHVAEDFSRLIDAVSAEARQ